MNHPEWYYRYYNKVLTYGKDYDYEVRLIDNTVSLSEKVVQEIGAGTGEHARRFLEKHVKSLELVDFDIEAIKILEQQFGHIDKVSFLNKNGFTYSQPNSFDIVICMYSVILLSIASMGELSQRLGSIIRRLHKSGYFFLEIIDYDICKEVFKQGSENLIFKNGDDVVFARSEYSQNQLHFTYFGNLEGREVSYPISLMRINKIDILDLLESYKLQDFGFKNLDNADRKLLIYGRT